MKKSLISLIALALSAGAMAQMIIPDVVGIQLESNNGMQAQSLWYQATDADDAHFQNGKDATVLNMPAGEGVSETEVYIYNIAPYGNMASLYTTELPGKYIAIKTNATETNYKFTFTALYPTDKVIKIIDHENNDSIFQVVKGATYEFTAPAGKTLTNRFQFYKPFTPDEGEWYGCFMEDNKLYIYNNPYTADIVITDVTGAQVKSIIPRATPQTIDLSDLTAGNYNVILGNGQKELVINVK